MLIAASWPSKSDAAVTNRNGPTRGLLETPGRSLAAVFIAEIPWKSVALQVAKILI
jgi:hypothetical protein